MRPARCFSIIQLSNSRVFWKVESFFRTGIRWGYVNGASSSRTVMKAEKRAEEFRKSAGQTGGIVLK